MTPVPQIQIFFFLFSFASGIAELENCGVGKEDFKDCDRKVDGWIEREIRRRGLIERRSKVETCKFF